MDQKQRQHAVLAAVIEAYVHTGEPVGSKALASALGNTVSSATIRNDMADLAAQGYLEQPHTSAGRIPTGKAYRLYIDRLMKRHPISADKRRQIDGIAQTLAADPGRFTENLAQALAFFTGCAALSSGPERASAVIRRIELLRINPQAAVLVLITDTGLVQNRLCRFEAPVSDELLTNIVSVLSGAFAGKPLEAADLPCIQSLFGAFGGDALLCMPALTAFAETVEDCARADIALSGQMNLLQYPDFEKQRAQQLMHFLSQRGQLAQMLAAHPARLQVLLGSESRLPQLQGSSVILTRYRAGDGAGGTFGVIGPQRMDYATTIPQLEYFASVIGRVMADWM